MTAGFESHIITPTDQRRCGVDNVIEVSRLRKTYGPVVAVDEVSFGVRQGEIFGILGPNGAGKTTTVALGPTLGRQQPPRTVFVCLAKQLAQVTTRPSVL